MSRTDAILEAVRVIVEARRAELDAAQDLRALTIAIKIAPGRWRPRLAVLQLEREMVFTEPEKR
jgi:hypothetical protein